MKKLQLTFKAFVCLICLFSTATGLAQNVGVSSSSSFTPDASAGLDVSYTNKGLLIPRVALTATNAAGPITSPATSLLVYNTATAGTSPNNVVPGYYYWNGTAWNLLTTSAQTTNLAWSLTGNAATNYRTNFLGTTDNQSLRFRTNNTQRFLLDSLGNVAIGLAPVFSASPNAERLLVDAGSTSANPSTSYNVISGRGYLDNYLQLNIQNNSPTANASTDIVATADNGTETANFIDMGINSSANTSTGAIGGASTAYLYGTGNDMAIGNGTANKSLIFFTGGTSPTTYTERIRLDASGRVGIGTNSPTSDLTLFQSSGTGGAKGFRFAGNSIGGTNSGTGFLFSLGYNVTGNKQIWFGDPDAANNSSGTFLRIAIGNNNLATLDAVAGDNSVRRTIALGTGGDPNSGVMFGNDLSGTTSPSSYVWDNGNMAIGSGYKANAAPTNGLIVQGNVGIGTASPATKLHVFGANPLTLSGVATGTSTSADSLLTITSGLVRKLPISTFASPTNSWAITGNTGTTAGTNFIGTTDAVDFVVKTNGSEKARFASNGDVSIGGTAFNSASPEQLLVDAGTTSSYNVISGRGSINNYLQLNIQNSSNGNSASSDVVATNDQGTEANGLNFIDMGVNSSTYTLNTYPILNGANNTYLYGTGNDMIFGNTTASKSLIFFTGGTALTNERMRIDGTGKVGIGVTGPTATLHLKAGTATANTAPLKFTLGTNLTTPETGAVEFDGTNYFATSGTVRYTLAKTLTTATPTTTLDFPSTAANTSSNLTVTVTGAIDGDVVFVGAPNGSVVANSSYTAYVSAANTVTVKFVNSSTATIDPASGTFRVSVLKY